MANVSVAAIPSPANRRPPGPRGIALLGVASAILRDPFGSWQKIARQFGDVASLPFPGMNLVLVNHPDHVKHVFNSRHSIYPKPPMFEDVLFREPPRFHGMANGREWSSVRQMLNPKFSEHGLAPIRDLMVDQIVEVVDSWQRYALDRVEVDMQEEFTLLTMTVLLRTMFTRPVERGAVKPLADAFATLLRGMAIAMVTTPLPATLPRPYARRTEAAKATIFGYIDQMVADRRRHPVDAGDLLSMVLDGQLPDGSRLTAEHVRRELMGLIIGGYETTAAVMSWVLARLPFSPAAQAKAYAEVDRLGGRRVAHADLDALAWLRACFDEAQRLQGFPLNARQAVEEDAIGGYLIPKGTTVGVSGFAMHRDPRFWREPDRFDPGRFLTDDINRYAFLPFGIGPRRCLGVRMAYMVGLFTLTTALQRYHFAVRPGWQPQPRFSFSTIVKGGVPVILETR
jgi:cytochrome P450